MLSYCVVQISKGPEHSAVVYTPCTVEDDGLHVLNLTLPEDMISSDVLPDPGTNQLGIMFVCQQSAYLLIQRMQCSSYIQLPVCILVVSFFARL